MGDHCHTDVLVCGPSSSLIKTSGEAFLVLIFQATPHTCKRSSFDFERTCGSVCLSEHRCEACDTEFIPFSEQPRYRLVNSETHKHTEIGLITHKEVDGFEGCCCCCYMLLSSKEKKP